MVLSSKDRKLVCNKNEYSQCSLDKNKERNKIEKNEIVFGLKKSVKESIADKKVEDEEEVN